MNWDDLRVFLAVARAEGAVGGGPGGCALTPPRRAAASRVWNAASGAVLFAKSPQGLRPDRGGVAPGAAGRGRARRRWRKGRPRRPGQGASGVGHQSAIGAPDGCANYLLPQVCAAIGATHPDLDLQILALPRVVNLSRREADLAITVSQPATQRLRAEKLSDYHLSLAASRAWLATHGAPRQPPRR